MLLTRFALTIFWNKFRTLLVTVKLTVCIKTFITVIKPLFNETISQESKIEL
jgi:hypothetical protein